MAGALQENVQLANLLMGLGKGIFGSSQSQTTSGGSFTQTTSGGGSTTQTQFDQTAINAMLRSLMESNQGLATVAGSSRTPGLYNSTTRNLMLNDLLSRSAGEVATRTAPVVTTKGTETVSKQGQPTKTTTAEEGLLGGSSALPLLIGGGALALGSKKGRSIIDSIFGSGGGAADVGNAAEGIGMVSLPEFSMGTSVAGLNTFGGVTPSFGLDYSWGADAGSSLAATDAISGGFDFGMPLFSAVSKAAGGDAGAGMGGLIGGIGGSFLGPIGSVIGSSLGSAIFSDKGPGIADITDPYFQEGGTLDTVGDAIDSVTSGIEEFFGGCFITTAACEYAGLADDCHELQTLRRFRDTWLAENHPEEIKQYYQQAPAIVSALKGRNGAGAIFSSFFKGYILPAVHAIENENNEQAYKIYKDLFELAADLAAPSQE